MKGCPEAKAQRGKRNCRQEPDELSRRAPCAQSDFEQYRPEEVKLLLDAERPSVQQRIRLHVRCEIVRGIVVEEDVAHVKRRGPCRSRGRGKFLWRLYEQSRSERREKNQEQGREQTSRPPRVEARQVYPLGLTQLPEQQSGNEVPGDYEKYIYPDETTRAPG